MVSARYRVSHEEGGWKASRELVGWRQRRYCLLFSCSNRLLNRRHCFLFSSEPTTLFKRLLLFDPCNQRRDLRGVRAHTHQVREAPALPGTGTAAGTTAWS